MTKEDVEKNFHSAIEFHIEGMHKEGYELPSPRSYSKYMEFAA